MYSNERNVQILISLLKAHKVRKMVLSPGSANASFVASVQCDPDFELYSAVDERSAAYIACGLAEEADEPVVICCTGATASRNYMPGLTEAYYRKIPIIAITATRPLSWIGQNRDQLIDRTVLPNDIAVKSVHLPIVQDDDDAWECNLKVNDVLLEMKRDGGGPVHINLTTSYSTNFSTKHLPSQRVVHRFFKNSKLPQIMDKKIVIFVGSHSRWSSELSCAVDMFCQRYDAVVLYDQTSNYLGKYGIPCGMFDISGFPNIKVDLIIHIGNVSASWPNSSKEVWRINPDGEIRDTFKKLTNVFEMEEVDFFNFYCKKTTKIKGIQQYNMWNEAYKLVEDKLTQQESLMGLSSLWIAQVLHGKLPLNSVVHYGILNSLRCWNCFKLDRSIRGYSNTGGFGIDGGVSSLIGASLADKNKIYFGFFGDLAFFYDMNSIGNRHVTTNIRILVANNGLGGEFKNSLGNVQKAGLGDSANSYIAACGHYGNESKVLLKHYAESLGFEYLSANSKDEFMQNMDKFTSDEVGEKPILFEVFMNDSEDVGAIDFLKNIGKGSSSEGATHKVKNLAKTIIGENGVDFIKKIIR
ncbi:thiamine pyrophosphate-binding protein [Streptococcus lutetiensis]|uniref:thiamine pyrophosphate-binding protein n=1 Tax=Streptococcus lutetiensis TaxID=150055 RepID=UPI001BDA3AE6|nr:thiamine pyrophosphate-binding protein [Streptococcus lutetiensis]MBT0889305.1 2-succinyl-5-enolpyruvyl-6-hydroxy-3-cyclohexene-1-carboxylate synthase [Streptococcus lutetiensis]MBT0914204.1 2-succinyl-5-enolpyruvyl-6-hydroxy-3-cyclohexene-1-carboxylate synthase [Streptococcus lutetiensis]MBT0915894.1 2-succinyl-5-enolpyruvyl-6-hydroxy-3-cyclohexene-1-carboxylate synthase [Streptococcus lutetiensis]MBT0919309.1 2-succinyl-5-enolpyruvyl-6-hydroxy-3-cyclohexene-1-carboxylate synthase [Streptoc